MLWSICSCGFMLLTLLQSSEQSCSDGTPRQCAEAEMAPGANLAGEGFDITTMERKGAFVLEMNKWKRKDKTCTLCVNPFMENKMQKLPLMAEDWRPKQSCSNTVTSKLYRSSESLVASISSSIENNWDTNINAGHGKHSASLTLSGSHSKLADYSNQKTKNDKYSFVSQSMSCSYYSYRVSSFPSMHRDFKKATKQLPESYSPENKQQFYKLINIFGTHFITKVKLGGAINSVTSVQDCMANLEGVSVNDVQLCLGVEASLNSVVEINSKYNHCKKQNDKTENKASFATRFTDRFTEIKGGHTTEPDILFASEKNPGAYKEWLATVPQHPDIISYSLESLHELLPANSRAKENLHAAIKHYILERALFKNCSSKCQSGIKSDRRDPCVCQCHNDPAVTPDCCPTKRGMARVIITVQKGSGLWGDHTTATDGYVKVFFNNKQVGRTPVINNNNQPHWAMAFDIGTQDLTQGNKVKFEVWDEDNKWDDDFLGACQQVLSDGVKEDLCNLNHGQMYFKLEVKCAPALRGETCTEYEPVPMLPSLRATFVSRHSHRVPKALLLEMGVFVEEQKLWRNQSNHDKM
ncbi:perforin-1-like [Synchiropus splendidus]|uniref:perforin-1-like n=1 Tax=Synchiropus splendidus TaxID=270530 RepID=UPI00237DF961|nr:perforin-1-like [Synchiropus splendidus]XP_053706996.1 perforin-1-like [Synchiropus splendidus]XP_053706997.1 perforin-1-like [Synchiropus splendidus]XP_053706998.1 perforin-1-like [Synchiropus splendidus]